MTRRVGGDDGFVTVQLVAATGMLLLLLVLVTNLLVDLYARGAVRGALDEGARAGARHDGGAGACERTVRAALASVLAGPVGRHVDLACEERDGWVVADGSVRLESWLPAIVPDWSFRMRAAAQRPAP